MARRQQQGGAPPPPEDDRDEAPRGDKSRGYRTGNDYPAQDDDRGDDSPEHGDRDIYGEDDPLPDDSDMDPAREGGEDNPDATRAGPPRKLVVVAGPDKGKVKRFGGVRLVVGRTNSCNIHLSDNSVSRRHLELVQGSNGVLLRDLGSGNGTRVNGERINEKLLKHEDVIEIGQTKLQYVDEAEAVRLMREEAERREAEEKRKAEEEAERKKAEEEAAAKAKEEAAARKKAEEEAKANAPPPPPPPPKGVKQHLVRAYKVLSWQQRIGLGMALGAVLFVMIVVVPKLFAPPPPPGPTQKEIYAAKKLELAKKALDEGRFQDAADLAESAERILPGSDANGYGKRAQLEVAVQKGFADARAFMDQQRFDDARAALAKVPDSTPQRAEEKRKLLAELDRRYIEALVKQINNALSALDVDAARQLIARLPEPRRAEFQPRLAEAERDLAAQEKHDREMASAHAASAAERRKMERAATIAAAFKAVDRKLNSGDFDRATLECDRVLEETKDPEIRQRAVLVKGLIPAFAHAWEEGQRKFNANAMESALPSLQKAHALYQQMGMRGALAGPLDDALMRALLEGGKSAMLRNDIASAARLYRQAISLRPNDESARAGMDRVAQHAEELYTEAYMERDRDPRQSLAKMRLVMEVAPKGSTAYENAKAQVAKAAP